MIGGKRRVDIGFYPDGDHCLFSVNIFTCLFVGELLSVFMVSPFVNEDTGRDRER